jgi:hypothetical protein
VWKRVRAGKAIIASLQDGDTIRFNIPGNGPFYLATPPLNPDNGYDKWRASDPLRQGETDGEGPVILLFIILFYERPDICRPQRGETRGLAVSLIGLIAPVRFTPVQPRSIDQSRCALMP